MQCMADDRRVIEVQVCYAMADWQILRDLKLSQGVTLGEAIKLSGICLEMPDIDPEHMRTGIYGKTKPLDTILRDGDRIEIYRPLRAAPKEARRRRVNKRAGGAAPGAGGAGGAGGRGGARGE